MSQFNVGDFNADHWVPLWGFGMGNDFGHLNETYFNASSGWRPTRWFDIASPFQRYAPGNDPDPFRSLDFELGVHGTPYKGFWYDAGLFWMVFDNRTETISAGSGASIIHNTGSSRSRGFEGELSYDFLELLRGPELGPQPEPGLSKDGKDYKQSATPKSISPWADWHLIAFSNVQLLSARFTDSSEAIKPASPQTFEGRTPAFAPTILWKGGLTLKRDNVFDVSLTAVYVSDEYWQDSDLTGPVFLGSTPAKIPAYKVLNLSGDWHITKHCKLIAGISNLTNEKYYSRVFFLGQIEPAPQISGYGGFALEF